MTPSEGSAGWGFTLTPNRQNESSAPLYTLEAIAQALVAIGDEVDSEGSLRITMNGGDIYRTAARGLRSLPT